MADRIEGHLIMGGDHDPADAEARLLALGLRAVDIKSVTISGVEVLSVCADGGGDWKVLQRSFAFSAWLPREPGGLL